MPKTQWTSFGGIEPAQTQAKKRADAEAKAAKAAEQAAQVAQKTPQQGK